MDWNPVHTFERDLLDDDSTVEIDFPEWCTQCGTPLGFGTCVKCDRRREEIENEIH